MSKQFCTTVSEDFFRKIETIKELGRGTYGRVLLVKKLDTGEKYAIKVQNIETDEFDVGITQPILTDADALVRLKDIPEIIHLVGICYVGNIVDIIMEAMDDNLKNFSGILITSERIRYAPLLLRNLVRAAAIFEELNILHFDIKPANILVKFGDPPRFVLTDFGLSRASFSKYHIPESEVFTLWYRPPEFLAERDRDTFNIFKGDIWSIGTVALEFILDKPLFPGDSSIDTLYKIRRISETKTGISNFATDNELGTISGFVNVTSILQNNLSKKDISLLDPLLIDILTRMLTLNPNDRPSAKDILSLLSIEISPEIFQSLLPPIFKRKISETGIKLILSIGEDLLLNKSTLIIALEIFTRFLGTFRDKYDDIYAVVALRIAAQFNEDQPPITKYLIDFYRPSITNEQILLAERELLKNIEFLIYNISLTPVIQRAYEQQINLPDVPLTMFLSLVDQWFL